MFHVLAPPTKQYAWLISFALEPVLRDKWIPKFWVTKSLCIPFIHWRQEITRQYVVFHLVLSLQLCWRLWGEQTSTNEEYIYLEMQNILLERRTMYYTQGVGTGGGLTGANVFLFNTRPFKDLISLLTSSSCGESVVEPFNPKLVVPNERIELRVVSWYVCVVM